MSLQTWTCRNCGEKFTVGKFLCKDGATNHLVDPKAYFLDDAPQDPGRPAPGSHINVTLREGRTRICNIPPDRTVLKDGNATLMIGGYVEFVQGRFTTSDPEIQYYLDKKGGFCTEERWSEVWLSAEQRLEMREIALAAREQRLENERNDLLASQKQARSNMPQARV